MFLFLRIKKCVNNKECIVIGEINFIKCNNNIFPSEKQEKGEAPKFIKPLKPKVAQVGKLVTLECKAEGVPVPEIRWYRATEEIVPDELHRIVYNPHSGVSTLTILEATNFDETIYAVRATNKFGRAECRANLVLSK